MANSSALPWIHPGFTAALALAALLNGTATATAADNADPAVPLVFPATATAPALPYRLVDPGATAAKPLPLIVCLHGAGERGTDNSKQIGYFRPFFSGEIAKALPAIVVLPQCPDNLLWATNGWRTGSETMAKDPSPQLAQVKALVDTICQERPVDRRRIILVGVSMGGYGAWEYATRWPEQVAALVPVCGGGDVTQAERLTKVAIWAFHGEKDSTIKPECTARMVEAVKKAGGEAKATFYPGVRHQSWDKAFSEPELPAWLAAQAKPAAATTIKKK